MTDKKNHLQKNLTFSQRYGYQPLPEPMRPGQISEDLRREVWNALSEKFSEFTSYDTFGNPHFSWKGERFVQRVLGKLLLQPEDGIDTDYGETFPRFRRTILTGPFNLHIDLLEAVINDDAMTSLAAPIQLLFEEHAAPYRLDTAQRPCLFSPRSSAEQSEAVQQALNTLQDADMDGAAFHLRQASEHMRAQQYGDSIADSIHAVESVARQIDPESNKTLGPALRSLTKSGLLKHPTLEKAFQKLYGYTCDEQGIRHALLDKDAPKPGLDEALFMFGACASFAAYLTAKYCQQK